VRKKLESEIGGTSAQNWGEVAPDFDSRFGGIEATTNLTQNNSRMHQLHKTTNCVITCMYVYVTSNDFNQSPVMSTMFSTNQFQLQNVHYGSYKAAIKSIEKLKWLGCIKQLPRPIK